MNTTARLVVSGHISPRRIINIDPSFGTQDEWCATMENVVDATPEMQDFADPETLGAMDAADGLYQPALYCLTLSATNAYNRGWMAETNRIEERECSIEFDHDFIRYGGA